MIYALDSLYKAQFSSNQHCLGRVFELRLNYGLLIIVRSSGVRDTWGSARSLRSLISPRMISHSSFYGSNCSAVKLKRSFVGKHQLWFYALLSRSSLWCSFHLAFRLDEKALLRAMLHDLSCNISALKWIIEAHTASRYFLVYDS
jgi:hypothetical protein